MCGIFGCFLNRPLDEATVRELRRATARLSHRGPDAQGEYLDAEKGVFLGHTRLKIIDLSDASAQPMVLDGHALSYNGEIYNFRDIGRDLTGRGHRIRSSGDTEVLLRSWIADGAKTLDRLDGMFAFALFDGERLHLATDPFGEKPLYLLTRPEGVYFSSEPQPLQSLADIAFAPSQEDVSAFIALGFFPGTGTGFQGLEKLEPASHLVVESCGVAKRGRYWVPPQGERRSGPVAPIDGPDLDAIEACLVRSIEQRLIADVPLGLFLSSGADSVLVAALISKVLNRDISAFTVAFPDGVDESGSVRAIAQHLHIDHTVIESGRDGSGTGIPEDLLHIYGEPNDNTTALSVRQMCKAVRPSIAVALSGTGGDELFLGYQKYMFLNDKQALYRWLGPLVDALRPIIGAGLDWLHPWKQLRNYVFRDPAWQFLAVKNNGCANLLRELPGMDRAAARFFAGFEGPSAFQAGRFDLIQTLPFSYIPAIDRGSMQASLEVRTPFLSRDLFGLVAGLDQRALLVHGRKKVAYDLLARHLPAELINRRKQGFVMPLTDYLGATASSAPVLPTVDPGWAGQVWRNRKSPTLQRLALRLDVLSQAARSTHLDRAAA